MGFVYGLLIREACAARVSAENEEELTDETQEDETTNLIPLPASDLPRVCEHY
jgi:hypothetical protein